MQILVLEVMEISIGISYKRKVDASEDRINRKRITFQEVWSRSSWV